MVFRISAALTRARELIWEPVFGHSGEKCERFLNFCDFTFKKFEVLGLDFLCNDFLCLVWGVRELAAVLTDRPSQIALVMCPTKDPPNLTKGGLT